MKRIISLIILLFLIAGLPVYAYENTSDIMSDTWVGTDELERDFPTSDEAGTPKEDKYVGIFYFLFMNSTDAQVVDTTETYLREGIEGVWRIIPMDGFHVWARPYFGYYRNTDPWIYRKHAQLLTDAGIDFVFLDTTNLTGLFENAWTVLLDTWAELRGQGIATPQVVFHNGCDAENMPAHIPSQMKAYKNEKYKDLWFFWDGKPLMLGNPEQTPQEYLDYFTIRESWAFNSFTGDGLGKWPWIAEYPQLPGKSPDGKLEQVVVSAGFHSNSSQGRSFSTGREPLSGIRDFGYGLDTSGDGLAFAEQWSRVFELDPSVVMITGWNEFSFGRWENAGPGQQISSSYVIKEKDPVFQNNYIDAFSAEYSRDIEPISQLFRDNYYCQMVQYIREFKGVRSVEKGTGSVDIDMSSDFSEFSEIGPVYYDTALDTAARDYTYITGEAAVNNSGRNDFREIRVSKTDKYVYFYAECTDDIILPEDGDPSWMNVFVDSDQKHTTGWSGYDFLIGSGRTDDGKISVESFDSSSWTDRTAVGEGTYSVSGNKIVIKVSSDLLNLASRDNFDFKLADHSTVTGEVMEFMDLGDAAPNSRFNYRYIKKGGRIVTDNGKGASGLIPVIIGTVLAVLLIGAAAAFIIRRKSAQPLGSAGE